MFSCFAVFLYRRSHQVRSMLRAWPLCHGLSQSYPSLSCQSLSSFFFPLESYLSFSVHMRRRLNAHLQQRMFRGHMLYRLQLDGRADNFEQRATSDLQALLDGLTCAAFGNSSDHLVSCATLLSSRSIRIYLYIDISILYVFIYISPFFFLIFFHG